MAIIFSFTDFGLFLQDVLACQRKVICRRNFPKLQKLKLKQEKKPVDSIRELYFFLVFLTAHLILKFEKQNRCCKAVPTSLKNVVKKKDRFVWRGY